MKHLHIVLSTALAPLIIVFCCTQLDYSCDALAGYSYGDFDGAVSVLGYCILKLLMLAASVSLFILLYKKTGFKQHPWIQVAFILLAWGLLFRGMIAHTARSIADKEFEQSLCNKTSGGMMKVWSENLSLREYECLQDRLFLLPELGEQADSISIDYYHDGFLPDFSLLVQFRVPLADTLCRGDHWQETKRGKTHKWMFFSDNAF